MNISSKWNYGSMVNKILMGLVLTAMIGSANVAPAFGDNDHNRGGRHDNGRYDHRGRGYDHRRHVPVRREYRPYVYRERVYVEPRVIYEPPPPPGISIFFPSLTIRP